jgi:hypothetical protein
LYYLTVTSSDVLINKYAFMLYLDSSPARGLVFFKKEEKEKK